MSTEQPSPEELVGLTPEEIALIAEGDDAPDAEPEQPAAAEPEPELRHDPEPALRAADPANADALLARCADFEQQATQAFEDGEITAQEYRAHLAQVADHREQARWAQRKAELASEMSQQAQDRAWYSEVDRFMRTTGAGIAKSHAAKVAFDEHVKAVTADPRNANLSDRAQLDKAYRLYQADMAGAFDAQMTARQSETGARGASYDFTALDRLAETDPRAFEAAVARMSPEEIDAYGR